MTVTRIDPSAGSFAIDVSAESLDKTAGLDQCGPVNLEKALRAQDRLGGHIVSGHVDGVGTVQRIDEVGESWELRMLAPQALGRFLAFKGSITVNGVSLTVNQVRDLADGCEISINLIPHTVHNTALGVAARRAPGQSGDRLDRTLRRTHARRAARRHRRLAAGRQRGAPA